MLRVYVAGPLTVGDLMVNVRSGIEAADRLIRLGFAPFLPHINVLWQLVRPHSWEEWLVYDEEWIRVCHALLRLPGESKGADREVDFAKRVGVPVFGSVEALVEWSRERVAASDESQG